MTALKRGATRTGAALSRTSYRFPAPISQIPPMINQPAETRRPYSSVPEAPKNKELAPTIGHLRSLDESLSDASLLSRMRTGTRGGIFAKNIYETIGAYKGNETLKSMAKSIIRKEMRGLRDSEQYYTYYHAHEWPIDLAQRVYAELYPSKNKEFFPLHFLTLLKPPKEEQHLIKVLQEKGSSPEVRDEKHLLSVNTAFFGNLDNPAESTASYVINNWSVSPPDMSLQALFEHLGHPDLYSKYASEWEKVRALHDAASTYGKVWLIKIPKKVHSQIVIPTKVLGGKRKFVIDGEKTDDVDLIQETLRTRPEAIKNIDSMQFRILMTPSTGLNPDLGIKTIPMNLADPEKYAAFEKAFYALMAKIKADIARRIAIYAKQRAQMIAYFKAEKAAKGKADSTYDDQEIDMSPAVEDVD